MSISERIAVLREEISHLRESVQSLRATHLTSALREAGVLGGYVPLQLQLHQRRTLRGHSGKVYAMQWSTDSNRIVSVAQDGKLIVWNAFAATREMALPLRSQWINSCSFAPSGQLVACCGLQGTCYVYRVAISHNNEPIFESRVLLHELQAPSAPSDLLWTSSILHPNASNSAASASNHSNNSVDSFAIGCRFIDDRFLVVGYADGAIAIWDLEARAVSCWCAGATALVDSFSASHSLSASAASVGWPVAGMFSTTTTSLSFSGSSTPGPVGHEFFPSPETPNSSKPCFVSHTVCDTLCMATVQSGSYSSSMPAIVANAGSDGVIRVWDSRLIGARPIRTFIGHSKDINALSFSHDGLLIASGSDDGTARLFDLRSCRQFNQFSRGIVSNVPSRSPSSQSSYHSPRDASISSQTSPPISPGSADATKSTPMFGSTAVESVTIVPESSSSSPFFRSVQNQMGRSTVSSVASVAFSASNRILFTGHDDFVCCAWDMVSADCLQTMVDHDDRVSAVGVAPDGKALCTGSWDSRLRIWA